MSEPNTPPAASTPPYPAQPAPHPQRDDALEHLPEQLTTRMPEPPAASGIGALGFTLIGGAVAAAVGLLAIPLFRRNAEKAPTRKAPAKRTPQARRPRRKASND